jgi:hypothetical protein
MKTSMKLILGLLLTALSLQGFAQKPEPVYSYIRQMHNSDWYEQQANAWKQEIDKGTKGKMAWVYWFTSSRILERYFGYAKWNSKLIMSQNIIKLAENAIPNSFELYFIKANDDYAKSESIDEYIMKAQALRPFDQLLLPWLVNYYQFRNDKPNLELTCRKWFESNEIPQELLITAYNNLISLEPNSILIVNGDNDTYPTWVLQYSQKIRPDVLVLHLSSAADIDKYRENVFKENGISPIIFKNKNDSTAFSKAEILGHLVNTIKNRPIYISTYSSFDEYSDFKNKMYFVGLSLKYSEEPFDNLAVIRNNVENKYQLDFLKHTFYNNYAQGVINNMNNRYIPIFLKLHEHYLASGETKKAQDIKELAKKIAENGGSNKYWMKYFEK